VGLLLRPDAYYAESPDGAYVLTHQGPLAFTERSVHQLVDRLAPYLDGRHTLDELTVDLPAERQEMVRNLITMLLERGVVRDVSQTDVREDADVAAGSGAAYRHDVAFIGYFRDSPDRAFVRYRDMVTLVLGAGSLLTAVARAAIRSGLRQVLVVTTAECPTDLELLAAEAERARRDPGQRFGRRSLGDPTEEAIESLLDGADLVVHASDRPMVERAGMLDRLCAKTDTWLAQAIVLGEHAWLGTPSAVPAGDLGWTAGWRRLTARRRDLNPSPREADAPAVTGPAGRAPDQQEAMLGHRVAAGRLVREVFRVVTGPAEAEPHRMIRVDLSTLHGESHPFVPHPFAIRAGSLPPAADLRHRVTTFERAASLTQQEFSRRAVACTGDRLGVLGVPTEREFAQTPLRVCEIEVSDPVGLLGPTASAWAVCGAGLDFETARCEAVMKAFAFYSSLMVDPRRLVTSDGRAPAGLDDDPDRALSALKAGRSVSFARGYGLHDHQASLVDAARVFPALRGTVPPALPPPGVAAGYSWREAVEKGLIGQCRRLTISDMNAATEPFSQLDLADAPLDGRGDRYRSMLETIGEPVTVYDVTGPLGVPTVLCHLGATPAACASGLSLGDALADALEQVLLQYQARSNSQPGYAPPRSPRIPDRLRGSVRRAFRTTPPLDVAALTAALERGHRPVAVPLDHDPEVNTIMPYTVHVVLTDA